MANQFWFKPRRFGYGATPISWEGWLLTAVYVVVMAGLFGMERVGEGLAPWIGIIVATALMLIIGRHKTQGSWGWSWGQNQTPDNGTSGKKE